MFCLLAPPGPGADSTRLLLSGSEIVPSHHRNEDAAPDRAKCHPAHAAMHRQMTVEHYVVFD